MEEAVGVQFLASLAEGVAASSFLATVVPCFPGEVVAVVPLVRQAQELQ